MNIDTYPLKAEIDFTVFNFVSASAERAINKLIKFQKTTQPYVYNLAFGDVGCENETLEDKVISNNRDTEKCWQ